MIKNWLLDTQIQKSWNENRDEIDFWGVNARIQPLQAIVASIELKKIKKILRMRNFNANFLDKELKNKRGNYSCAK